MIHDPMCELETCELMHPGMITVGRKPRCVECEETCICDVIAKVRADTLRRVQNALNAMTHDMQRYHASKGEQHGL